MRRPWQSKEVGCRLGPLHGGTAYQCSVQLPYGVSNTKHEVQDEMKRKRNTHSKEVRVHCKVGNGNSNEIIREQILLYYGSVNLVSNNVLLSMFSYRSHLYSSDSSNCVFNRQASI